MFKFDVNIAISLKQDKIENLITCAIEGGSNYWYRIEENNTTETYEKAPFNADGKGLLISNFVASDNKEDDYKEAWLTVKSIETGLQVMATKHTSHLMDVLEGNEDASTGDVFLQCCLFGEVLYG